MPVVHWLRVTRTCNNACTFCSESAALDGAPVPLDELTRALDDLGARLDPARGAVEVRLAGGEPTLSPHLPALIEDVARRGFSPVLVTNGRALAKPGRLQHLVGLGLAGLRVSLHGASPATHDGLVGVPGAFRQSLSALALAASANVRRTLSFVLTHRNVEELPALLELARRVSCNDVELRDVLPTEDRTRFLALRVPDDAARRALDEARTRALEAKIHLRVVGFERAAGNTRASAFGVGARWPDAAASRPSSTPARVVILGRPKDPVIQRSTIPRVAEAIEQRGIPTVQVSVDEPLSLRDDDMVLCTGYPEVTQLFRREPRARDLDVRVMDFHMLHDFGAFRSLWVPEAHQQTSAPWWPSPRLKVISCFPGHAPLYAWYGVPPEALQFHPYPVDPKDFRHHPEPERAAYAFSGGDHLRDIPTLVAASARRRDTPALPIHVYHLGPPGPPAPGIVYRGTAEFSAFYTALAASRVVVLPLSRAPDRAAGITVAAMALAAGRAIVASAIPAMRDHLEHGENAWLVEPEDPVALAEAIDRLTRDHDLRAELERGARAAAATSTGETFVDVLLGRRPAGLLSPAP